MKELRASFDKKLDALEYQALEAQLIHTKEEAIQRLEQGKQQLRDLLSRVQVDVQKSKEIAAQAKTEVQAKLEHLQVQLALGKANARDTFEEQREKILKALNEFESVAEQKLKGVAFESGKVWEDLVGRTSKLEAELEALKDRFESENAKQHVTSRWNGRKRSYSPSWYCSRIRSRLSAWRCRAKPMFLRATCAKG